MVRRFWNPVALVLASIIILGSLFVRTCGLGHNGIHGTDTFVYWEIAKKWARGEYVFNTDPWGQHIHFYRPVFYALNLLSTQLFGVHDYSIKLLIALAETGSLGLLFALGWRVGGPLVGVTALALYAATPASLVWTQTELAHPYVTFLILSSALACYWSYPTFSRTGIILGGLCAGLASLCHGTANFLVCGIGISLLVDPALGKIRRVVCFGFSFLASFVLVLSFFGFKAGVAAIMSEAAMHHHYGNGAGNAAWHILEGGFIHNSSIWFVGLTSLAALALIVRSARIRSLPSPPCIFIVPVTYLMTYSVIFDGEANGRFFLSLIPFCSLLTAVALAHELPRNPTVRVPLLILVCGLTIIQTVYWRLGTIAALFEGREKGESRSLFETLGPLLNSGNRLLIVPSQVRSWPKRIDAWPYIAEEYVRYLFDCKDQDLLQFIKEQKVGLVYFAPPSLQDPSLRPIEDSPTSRMGSCVGLTPANYSIQEETARISESLAKLSEEQVFTLPGKTFRISYAR